MKKRKFEENLLEEIVRSNFSDPIELGVEIKKLTLDKMQNNELINSYVKTAYKFYQQAIEYFEPDLASDLTLLYMFQVFNQVFNLKTKE